MFGCFYQPHGYAVAWDKLYKKLITRWEYPNVTALSVYLLTLTTPINHKLDHTQVNLIQLKPFDLDLDFAEYNIQYTDVRVDIYVTLM